MISPAPRRATARARLIEWHATLLALRTQIASLDSVVGISPEGPLLSSIYATTALTTRTLADMLNISVEWLDWWQFECDLGDHPMRASIGGTDLQDIASIEQLADLLLSEKAAA